jgi:hypothetical protein
VALADLVDDALVDELRPVADRVARELLTRLVRERADELIRTLNGDSDEALHVDDGTRVCSRCHRRKPPDAFDPERKTCRQCRERQRHVDRKRRAARQDEARDENGAARPAPAFEGELAAAAAGLRGPRAQEIALGQRADPARPAAIFA